VTSSRPYDLVRSPTPARAPSVGADMRAKGRGVVMARLA
jgi:hypothetical protein